MRRTNNLLFGLAAWESLPGPIPAAATSVSILFPWGSLLRAVVDADPALVAGLRGIAARGAKLEIVTAIEPATDASELRRLDLTGFSAERMAAAWRDHGFRAALRPLRPDHAYQTTWWRRIRRRPGREPVLLTISLD